MRIGIRVKLLIFAAFVWVLIFGAYGLYSYKERIEQTHRMALNTASYLSREIVANRQTYASIIVKRAIDAGLPVTHSFESVENAIPIPDAYMKEVSESLGTKGGFYTKLVSLNPINQANKPVDEFQRQALEHLHKGGDTLFYKFEDYRGKQSLRYMIPDLASSEVCVNCHRASFSAVGKDLRIGDILGGLEIIVPIENELAMAMADIWRSIGYGFIVIVAMGLAGLAFIRYVVTSPVLDLVETTKYLATGDLTNTSSVTSNDELGDLGVQTNNVVKNLHTMIEDIRRVTDELLEISGNVSSMSRFVHEGSNKQGASLDSINSNVQGINTSIVEIASSTERLASSVEKGSSSVLELGAIVSEVVENMEALFMSIEEATASTKDMSDSIKEISENIENLSSGITQVSSSMMQINARIKDVETNAAEASKFAEEVIKDARSGMESVESTIQGIERIKYETKEAAFIINSLSARIMEVGKILDVITDIAEETNLLALNAAIIAAQSGENGKSFSVVANEIKELAERTAASAKEVSEIISAIELESNKAVRAMERGFESVEEGVRLSAEAGDGLKKIVDSAQRSTSSVREIARASAEQARESRMVVDASKRVAEMTRRVVNAAHEQARGSELINKASEKMAEIAYRVKNSTKLQAEENSQITRTMEDVNRMVAQINNVIREQSRNTERVLEAIASVRKISVENIEKASEADMASGNMDRLTKELKESVSKFRLKNKS